MGHIDINTVLIMAISTVGLIALAWIRLKEK